MAQETSNSCKTKLHILEAKLQCKKVWFRISECDKKTFGKHFCTTSQVDTLPLTSSHEKIWIFLGTGVFHITLKKGKAFGAGEEREEKKMI